MREAFYRIGIVSDQRAEIEAPYLVLDTNVVSAMQSLAVNGYDQKRVTHRRAYELLRWIQANQVPESSVDASLDVIEGSSIHKGHIDIYNLLRRRMVINSLLRMTAEELKEFVASGEPAQGSIKLAHEQAIRAQLRRTESLLTWLFYPAYTVVLAAFSAFPRGEVMVADELVKLSANVPVLPDSAVIAGLLQTFGDRGLKQALEHKFFKFRKRGSPEQRIHSAAWDLALLEYATLMAMPGEASGNPSLDDIPALGAVVIVTQDEGLATLAQQVVLSDRRGRLVLRSLVASVAHDNHALNYGFRLATYVIATNVADAHGVPQELTFEHFESSILRYENELGITPARINSSVNGVPAGEDWPFRLLLLEVLLGEDMEILQLFHDWTNWTDVLTPEIGLCLGLIQENAEARKRSEDDTLFEVVIREGTEPLGTRLVLAAHRGEAAVLIFNSMYKQLAMGGTEEFGVVIFTLVRHLQALISDTAAATGETRESVRNRWIQRAKHLLVEEINALHEEALIEDQVGSGLNPHGGSGDQVTEQHSCDPVGGHQSRSARAVPDGN